VFSDGLRIQPIVVQDAAFRIADGDNLAAEHLLREAGRIIAGVAVALNRNRGLRKIDPHLLGGLADGEQPASGGRIAAALGSAESERLPGQKAELVFPREL